MRQDVDLPYEKLGKRVRKSLEHEQDWQKFHQDTIVKYIEKGQHLIRAGEKVDQVYFCVKGLFRLYYTLPDGREYNKGFVMENDFFTSYGALISRGTSYFSIEALESAVVIDIPYDLLQEMMAKSHAWESFVRREVELLYMKKEERERELLFLSAEERYEAFVQKYPDLLKRVPQYQIAAYLGISPVSLSRMLRLRRS